MKAASFLLLALIGCTQQIPPTHPDVIVVEVAPLPPPRVYGQVVDVEVIEPPRSTWITGDELQKLKDERHERAVQAGRECRTGDPLCTDIQ